MSMRIKKLHPLLAAEVTGISLHKPLDPHTIAEIDAAWQEFGVLVEPFDHGGERRVMHRTSIAGTEAVNG